MSNDLMTRAWLKGIQPDSKVTMRLFCFSYAGGGASTYLRWRPHITNSIDICALQPPGREDRISEQPISDLSTLISHIADVITPHTKIPYAFFGHCNGALVSFELAREMRRRNIMPPQHMFVSSFRSPGRRNTNRVLHDLPQSTFLDHLRAYGGMPEEILNNDQLMDSLMPTIRADFSLHENYAYREEKSLDCPFTILGGLQDSIVNRKELSGWRDKTRNSAKISMFPGGHFFIDTHREYLLKMINDELLSIVNQKNHLTAESA